MSGCSPEISGDIRFSGLRFKEKAHTPFRAPAKVSSIPVLTGFAEPNILLAEF